jgi:GDP-mannose 6-dehydrogenase
VADISIFGLGYVGSVSAACLSDLGNRIIGVDVSPIKIDTINSGQSPIIEEGLGELIARGVSERRLSATAEVSAAVQKSDISMICVGTPSNANGSLDLGAVQRVSESIGTALSRKDQYHTVVVRSTMLPGSTDELVIPTLEHYSGKQAGVGFGVCYNPEFLREGSSIRDFHHPPYTIIGGRDERPNQVVSDLYSAVDAPIVEVPLRAAEMLKYANNAFHALKVAFANEIGLVCKRQGIDSHTVMDLFAQDRKLNIAPTYLRPGFAFGGSCLPKDLRALVHLSHTLDLNPAVLEAILPSNQRHIETAFEMVRDAGCKRVGVLGLSFKQGTDDLRESPLVALVERLIGRGYDVRVFDRNVSLARLHGANRAYIEAEIPHIMSIMADSVVELIDHSEVIVIGNSAPEHSDAVALARAGQRVIDLVGVGRRADRPASDAAAYEGICW